MTSLTALQEVQAGLEPASDAYGAEAAPTRKLAAETAFTITPQIEYAFLPALRGDLAPAPQRVVSRKWGQVTEEGWMSYEDVPYLQSALFKYDSANAASDSPTSDGVWTHTAPLVASDIATKALNQTFVYGDGTDVFSLTGCVLQTLTIRGEDGAAATYTAEYFGKTLATDALDSDVSDSDRSQTIMMGDHVTMYIDPGSDAVTTAVSDVAFSFELVINTNRKPIYHLGELSPTGYREDKWSGTLSVILESNATTRAYVSDILADTAAPTDKNFRFKFTSGTLYWQFDFGGIMMPPEIFTDEDGVTSWSFTVEGQKTSGLSNWFGMETDNTLTALV